jgi:cellulose synthase/poly-beta-1,6-N-acetylglucosamine synthase-like glycosyltransferase
MSTTSEKRSWPGTWGEAISPDRSSQTEGLAALIGLAESLTTDANSSCLARRSRSGIVAIVPARDEGMALADTLRSMARQTLRPDRIVIVVNNSTDDTIDVAFRYSASGSIPTDVLEMPGFNPHRKAGALNYGIHYLLREGLLPPDVHYLLVMDGDTELDLHFLKTDS